MTEESLSFKLVFLGDTLVGKTCIANRMYRNIFVEASPTIGSSFVKHTRQYGGTEVTANIWDTAGQERYMALTSVYYRSANVAAIVYDVTNFASFERARFWINEVRQNVGNCDIVLVGNKVDLLQEGNPSPIPQSEIDKLVTEEGCRLSKVSAKTGDGISDLTTLLFELFLTRDHSDLLQPAVGQGGAANKAKPIPAAKQPSSGGKTTTNGNNNNNNQGPKQPRPKKGKNDTVKLGKPPKKESKC